MFHVLADVTDQAQSGYDGAVMAMRDRAERPEFLSKCRCGCALEHEPWKAEGPSAHPFGAISLFLDSDFERYMSHSWRTRLKRQRRTATGRAS